MPTRRTDLISVLSATALTGRFDGSLTVISIFAEFGNQRAAPAPRAKGADRRQRQQWRVERQDRSMRREVIRRRSGRSRDQHTVADQRVEAHAAVDENSKTCRLVGLAQQRNFVDRLGAMDFARHVLGFHVERADQAAARRREALGKIVLGIFVHQEADRALVHAVDRLAGTQEPVLRRQHEAVAAERDDHVGGFRRNDSVALGKQRQRLLRRGDFAGDESNCCPSNSLPPPSARRVLYRGRLSGASTAALRRHR